MTALAGSSALSQSCSTRGNAALLADWITAARAAALPHLHAFAAGLALPDHDGWTEEVNTKR